jgi:hypothetical protein
MKNKNTVSKKNEKLIQDIKEMVNQFAMAGDEFKSWREAWMELVEQLENGADYERHYGAWPGPVSKS